MNTMRRTAFLLLSLLLLIGVAFAEDFWEKKEYMQWSDEEVKKLMTNSPWSKDIDINAPISMVGGRGQRAAAASPTTDIESGGGGGRGRGRGARGGGDSDAPPPALAIVTLNVSWRSALPMRKGVVRSRLGASAQVPAEAEQLVRQEQPDYVVVVTGVPAALARAAQNPELLDKSTIRAGKKPLVAAKSLDVQARTQTVDLIYSFPKTQSIAADDKEVEVVIRLGQIEAKKKFSLKDMVYNGKLEL
jgi:hypothetical protein